LRKITLYIAESLDGYIARENGQIDWLTPFEGRGEDYGYSEFIGTVDTVVMGRATYDQVKTFGDFPYKGKTCYVLSRALKGRDEHVEFIGGDVFAWVRRLKAQPGAGIWLVGGARAAEAFFRERLIDEYILSIVPVVLGAGIPLGARTMPLHGRPRELGGRLKEPTMIRQTLLTTFFLAAFSSVCAAAETEPKPRMMDLDQDGVKEATVYYQNGLATRAKIDRNQDNVVDGLINYRDGFRDYAEIDSDYDGIFETVIDYYFTGVPAAIKIDRDGDGDSDSARYFKNGFLYKREWDRNGDGQPDFRVIYQLGPDLRPESSEGYQRLVKQYDTDFDGVFDRDVEARRKIHVKKADLAAGSVASV
jgi:dihydrofolate reductase